MPPAFDEPQKTQFDLLLKDRNAFNEYIYTPITEAYEILEARQHDDRLKKKVLEYFGDDVPEPFLIKPRSVITRHLITPNQEIDRFIDKTKKYNHFAPPSFFEYLQDKLIFKNPFKHSLVELRFGSSIIDRFSQKSEIFNIIVADKTHIEGLRIADVPTFFGSSLVALHHRLFLDVYPHFGESIFDCSDLFKRWGTRPDAFYQKFFSLFIYHGILFENYLLERKTEKDFIEKIILPYFTFAKDHFGLRPLIVSLDPIAFEGADNYWNAYPTHLYPIFKRLSDEIC